MLRVGNPGNKGGGRPRDEWKAALASMASSDEVMKHLRAVLSLGPEHPFFGKALEFAAERGYGKEATPIEHDGSVTLDVRIRAE